MNNSTLVVCALHQLKAVFVWVCLSMRESLVGDEIKERKLGI